MNDPYAIQLAKLSGLSKPTKARQAFQEWMVVNKETVNEEIDRAWTGAVASGQTNGPLNAAFRSKIAREMFSKLPEADQLDWAKRAKATAEAAKSKYLSALSAPPSTDPTERAA